MIMQIFILTQNIVCKKYVHNSLQLKIITWSLYLERKLHINYFGSDSYTFFHDSVSYLILTANK